MSDILASPSSDDAIEGVYIFSRDWVKEAYILLKEGLFATRRVYVAFEEAKLSPQAIANFKLAKRLLEPHPHSPKIVPDIDVERHLSEVERQDLFLSLLVDRLNNPSELVIAEKNTSFSIEKEMELSSFASLPGLDQKQKEALRECPADVPIYIISLNDGSGHYRPFVELRGLPDDESRLDKAIIEALYNLERVMRCMAVDRRALGGARPSDGLEGPR